jgi:hypothetical protein
LQRKVCMLLIGNVIGLFWNHIFFMFADIACSYFGEFCNGLFIILNPFLNLIWIVSFWSISDNFCLINYNLYFRFLKEQFRK